MNVWLAKKESLNLIFTMSKLFFFFFICWAYKTRSIPSFMTFYAKFTTGLWLESAAPGRKEYLTNHVENISTTFDPETLNPIITSFDIVQWFRRRISHQRLRKVIPTHHSIFLLLLFVQELEEEFTATQILYLTMYKFHSIPCPSHFSSPYKSG